LPPLSIKEGETINVPPLKERGWGDLEQEKGEDDYRRFVWSNLFLTKFIAIDEKINKLKQKFRF
jgi:hypothetical protein